jgi:hypothetical protein
MFKKSMKRGRKGAIELEVLAWWIIAVVILVLILIAYFVLSGKGIGVIEHIKNLFRFRGG